MKLKQCQEIQLATCLRMVQDLFNQQTKRDITDKEKCDLLYFRKRKRELLKKIKKEQE